MATPIPFVVRGASVKSNAGPPTALESGGSWGTDFPVARVSLSLQLGVGADGTAAPPGGFVVDGIDVTISGASHIEARGGRTSVAGLGPVVLPRVELTSMIGHRDAADARRTTGHAALPFVSRIVQPPPAVPSPDGHTPEPHVVTGIELFLLCLWEPATPITLKSLRVLGRHASALGSTGGPALPTPTPGVPPAPSPLKAHRAEAATAVVPAVAAAPTPPLAAPPLMPPSTRAPPPVAAAAAAAAAAATGPAPSPWADVAVPTAAPPSTTAPAPVPAAPPSAPTAPIDPVSTGGKPLAGCVLCLSGFQNPLRGVIKGEAISLGATVAPAWTPSCTHLVCAVANTPKHQEVLKSGHGYVVSRMWLNDCALQTKRLPEDHYALA